jgi:methionyl-tRNA formyltransferase
MRLLMMGTGPFAVPTLHALLESHHAVTGLVTRPLESSRSRKAIQNPMLEAAQEAGIPVEMPADINSPAGHEALVRFAPELLVVCDYGQILSSETLLLSPLGGINLHGSLLPRYRGAAPVNWAIMAGDQVTGTSVIHMTPQLDGGPLLARSQIEIGENEDAQQLEQRLATSGITPVLDSLELLEKWDGSSPLGELQLADQVTQARRLRKSDGQLDWTRPAVELHNRVRGLKPWPGSYTHWLRSEDSPMRLIIVQTTLCDTNQDTVAQPGQVVASEAGQLLVATGAGILSLQEIQPAGRRAMQVDAFLRGYPVAPGDRFGD